MKSWIVFAGALALSMTVGCGSAPTEQKAETPAAPPAQTASAEIKNAKGESVGTASFTEAADGVTVDVKVANLTPGQKGLHIHETGSCADPDFKSAGGHFNPTGKEHGEHNPAGKHLGDLGNIEVGADGTGSKTETVAGLSLGSGDSGLFRPNGTAIVVHAAPDDMKSNPAGNAGARIGCGVISK